MSLIKRAAAVFMGAVFTASAAYGANTVEFRIGSTDVNIDNGTIEKKTVEAAPYTKNDRALVPLRVFSEALGCSVEWNEETNSATVKNGENIVVFSENSNEMNVNGEKKLIDTCAEVVKDRMFVPLRAVSEGLGFGVYYVDSTEHILIDAVKPVMNVGGTDVPFCVLNGIYAINGGKTADDVKKQEIAQYSYLVAEDIYSAASKARSEGQTVSDEMRLQLNSIFQSLENSGSSGVLYGDIMKLQEDYMLAVSYVNKLRESITVTEKELYDFSKDYVRAKHILISFTGRSEKEALDIANSVYDKAKKGEDFDKLIKEYGEDPGMSQNPDGYIFTKGMMVEEFEKMAYALLDGEISKPVKTPYGYHIIYRLPMAEKLKSLEETLKDEKLNQLAEKLRDESAAKVNMNAEEFVEIAK